LRPLANWARRWNRSYRLEYTSGRALFILQQEEREDGQISYTLKHRKYKFYYRDRVFTKERWARAMTRAHSLSAKAAKSLRKTLKSWKYPQRRVKPLDAETLGY
jgi:hypothetical protein